MSAVRLCSRLVAAGMLVLSICACSGEISTEIATGIDVCSECNMIIDKAGQAGGYVRHGEFTMFDSPGCLLRSYQALRRRGEELPPTILFADYRDGAMHPAESVTFLLSDHIPTVMESRVACFGDREGAEAARSFDDEILTDWAGYRTARGEPDRVFEVTVGGDGMVPKTLEALKGELLLWRVTGRALERDLVVSVRGYPEAGSVTVPADGTEVAFRLEALRPGDGFPVVRADDGAALGMLKVAGAHTSDEGAM